MATYGLTAAGFVPKTFEIIRAEINEEFWDTYGRSLDLSDLEPLGQMIAIFAEREASLWEALQAAHDAMDPDNAVDTSLDSLSAISGTRRADPTASTVVLYLSGTNATVVPAGSQASEDTTGDVYETDAEATLATASSWAAIAYVVGDVVTNDTNIWYCSVAGTASVAPTGDADFSDGSVDWIYVGDGAAYASVQATAAETGAKVANAYAISTIQTVVAGWSGVKNMLDADVGSGLESNAALRIRRADELFGAGTTPKDALRVDILSLDEVTACTVFVNNSDVTDPEGIPPHAIEVLVQTVDTTAETNEVVASKILESKSACTGTYGDVTVTVQDSELTNVDISFSRPTDIDIYVDVTLTYDADLYPADGDAQVEEAIVAYGDAQASGKDVVSSRIKAACFTVPGVLDVTLAYIGTSASPVSEATVAISLRELAVFDTSRIGVVSSEATP